MAKQTEFTHPPEGHVALVAYNATDNTFYIVRGSDAGALKVTSPDWPLPTGAAKETKQNTMITTLQSLQNLVGALHDVGVDELDVQVIASALPSGAATDTHQGTMITTLQSLQNLVGALHDVGVDELDVNVIAELPAGTKNIGDVDVLTMPTTTVQAGGGDKIFSFESIVEEEVEDLSISTSNISIDGTAVDPDKVWMITYAAMKYTGTPPARLLLRVPGLAGSLVLIDQATPTSGAYYVFDDVLYLQEGDLIRVQVVTGTIGDAVNLRYCGVQMDAP